MRILRNLSIQQKLTGIIVFTSIVALLLVSVAFVAYDRISTKRAMVRNLDIIADIIADNSTAALVSDNERDAVEILASLEADGHIVAAAIHRADGSLLAGYHSSDPGFALPVPREDGHRFGEDHLDLFSPVVLDGERVGTITIRSDLREMQDRQARYATIVVVFLLASIGVAYLLTSILQRTISAPILDLARVARIVTEHSDYSVRAVKSTQDEIGLVAEAYNEMLAQIQELDAVLQTARDALGGRVDEGSHDLKSIVDHLHQEIQERQRAEEALVEREEQLRQSQKMEAVGNLACGVAHDFNNQLAIIRGYVDTLLDDSEEGGRFHSNLTQVNQAVQRANSLTDQLLLFSSRQPVNMRPVDLNRHIHDLQKMLVRLLGEDVAMDLDLEEDLCAVNADPGNIDQVVTNLSVNARDAMPDGGSLSIRTRNAVVDEDQSSRFPDGRPGRFVCLSIADTGVGMYDEVRSRLFEPFFTTKGPGKGTGLGLSVVYGIVQAHNGWITVESEPDRGSRFDVYMPTVEQQVDLTDSQVVSVDLSRFHGNGERILVVEDEPALRQMIEQALADRGFSVVACANTSEAGDTFRTEEVPFDLVLSDVVLPDGRGTDLVFRLLEERPELAAILVTGYTDERADWERARDAGLVLLQKPIPVAMLLEQVVKALAAKGRS